MANGKWQKLCVDVAQGHVAVSLGLVAEGVLLAEVFGLDDDVRHGGKPRFGNWTGLTGLTGLKALASRLLPYRFSFFPRDPGLAQQACQQIYTDFSPVRVR